MQASELRIGNSIENEYLNVDLGMDVWIVVKVDYHILYDLVHGESKKYRPMVLTEQWLLDFGFRKYNNVWVLPDFIENDFVRFHFTIYNEGKRYTYNSAEFPVELQYVHRLQDLFYALTGEELTLKEKV
jgi:hypothetical protein